MTHACTHTHGANYNLPPASRVGNNKLVDSLGYTYKLKRQSQYIVHWQCTVRSKNLRCRTTVKQRGSHFTAGSHSHVHQAEVGSLAKVPAAAKAAGRSEVFKSAGAIVQEVLTQHTAETFLPKSAKLARLTNRHRQKMRPNHPHDLEFDVDYDHIPDNFLQEDMVVNERRHLLFAIPHQIALLRNARRWYVDGTFKVMKEPFTQLLSVHAFLRQGDSVKQVPLAFMLMSGRNQSDYKAVFSSLNKILGPCSLEEAVLDFEAAMWHGLRFASPDISFKGCVFHWVQSVDRKLRELGLQFSYNNDEGTRSYCRRLFALPFLPAEMIQPQFQALKDEASSATLITLCDYVDHTWIKSKMWKPVRWSVFFQRVHTNNDLEG